jgi:colanic acid/amylovoran biosynthesis glycosyltransferase
VSSGSGTRVVYVTARLPFAEGEPFIVPEVLQLVEDGCDVLVVPTRTEDRIADDDARELLPRTVTVSLWSPHVAWAALRELLLSPARVARTWGLLFRSRSVGILLKNHAVLAKGLWLARHARERGVMHIHAHWAGTSATLAMVAAEVGSISWSFTAHRWDIAEDNLLREKARRACFVRAISAHGAEEFRRIVGEGTPAPWVLHMGVRLPPAPERPQAPNGALRLVTAARFVEKKGHGHVLEAMKLLQESSVEARLELAGDGPLESELRRRASEIGVEGTVVFLGRVSHDQLLADMAAGRWDAMVLPSIVTAAGQLEGIPVSLIEAMASGLPVIGTAAGGVPELLADGAGLLVPPADPAALAAAIEELARDPAGRASLGARGRARVEEAFAVERIAAELHARFRECALQPP